MQKAISKYWPVFVLPTLIAFIIGFIWPFIWGIYLSFQRFTTVSKTTFVGIQNYINVFQDSTFLHAFGFTAAFTVVSTVLINVCAFAIALVLTRGIRGTNIFRTVYFMPNLIGGILLGYIWQILLNGVLANLQKPLLALDAKAGFVGLVILMCWQQIGYMMIIYVAGLQSVPGDLIEAAKIDGASDHEILFKIKLPMVMPSVTICTFLTLTNSFKLFDQNVALTAGEPANASEMLALNIYNTFYGRSGGPVFFLAKNPGLWHNGQERKVQPVTSLTKRAIRASFLKLLNERPLNKITVKDIVEDCGINRNSFYYHYPDIPALAEEIVRDEAARIVQEYPTVDSLEQCLEIAVEFALQNRTAVLHLYNSASHEAYEHSLMDICRSVVGSYFDTAFAGKALPEADREVLVRFYQCECYGQIVLWMSQGMQADIVEQFRLLCHLRQGMMEEMVARCCEKS